jgi:hypothetical protein
MSGQILTYGSNQPQTALYSVTSKDSYQCANSSITRGVTNAPSSLDDCFTRFPGVQEIASSIGFYTQSSGSFGGSGGGSGASGSNYTLWTGASVPTVNLLNSFTPVDVLLDKPAEECNQVVNDLGLDWLGCLWGTPEAPYSCTCPDLGPKYEAYIKHRLNIASFWNTPVETPVKRAEFVDALQYGRKINVTVAGDFNLKVGQVMYVRLNGISGYPYSKDNSVMNGLYYVMGIKHVFTSSGTHETALSLSNIAPDYSGADNGGPYYP